MIERRFLDWTNPALPELAGIVADERFGEDALDLAEDVFVVPVARAGRRLVELLVQEAESRALRLSPPRTPTVRGLPELLYAPDRPLADPVLSGRMWAGALRAVPRDRLGVLVPEPPEEADLAGWAGLASVVQSLHREVTREGLGFRDVAERCRRGSLFDDSARWEVLAEVRDRYRSLLRGVGRSDRYEARIEALAEGRVRLERPDTRDSRPGVLEAPWSVRAIHLVGMVELPGVARRMLDRVAGDGTPVIAWIQAPEAMEERFDAFGCVEIDAWTAAEVRVPDEMLAVRERPADQAAEALRALASFDGAYTADEITVGIPDPEVVPWLEQRFRAHGVPARVAEGTPLERTSPFRLLEGVADYLDGRRFVDLAALLRHPAVDRRLDRGRTLEVADRYHARHLPGRVHDGMPGAARPREAEDPRLRDLLDLLHGPGLLGSLGEEGLRTLSGWMPEILAFLARVFGDAPLRPERSDHRVLLEVSERLRDAAASFHRLPREADEECRPAQALRVLLGELRRPDAAVPPEPDRAAVEMLGWLDLHLDDAPALVVTGFNEGRVPKSVSAHPFLPDRLRTALGLVDNRARRARDAYLLTALLHSRRALRIVAGRSTAGGDPLRPSRLLLSGTGEPLARRVLRFVRSDPEPPPPLAIPGLVIPDRSTFRAPPEPEIRLAAAPEDFAVTEFRVLLQDRYRWVLERRMGLRCLHDEAREMDPLEFGSLAHAVLEAFSRKEWVASPDAREVARCLDRILDAAVERRFGSGSLPAIPLQVEQLRRRIGAFAEWHAGRIDAGWRVVGAEVSTPDEGVPFDVDGRPVRLRGRIDRIDVHDDTGAVAVFDYKTGDTAKDPEKEHRTRGGEWRDLQLPLYRHLLSHLERTPGEPLIPDLDVRTVHLGYVRLPKDAAGVGEAMADWDEVVLESAFERARSIVRELRADPSAVFDPAAVRSGPWDPLGPLLGRGILSPIFDEGEIRGEIDADGRRGHQDR